ncbi:type VII secretion protein EccB [Actinophytocola sp.]|uniref:type VII secretion protein EccB n=1 Tax=Actinophytocola sp. TaxID=1872138 RepID=UPI002D3A55F5|nr:type VII secretion protein EccB [Actinophytocola sp.]HYQ63787.1 type VII secretion protein EccB [Actinophytocola sp.]
MQTRRDHVHAHQFLMGRLSSALVLADPASAEVPAKRALSGLVIGLVLALLTAGGIAVFGLIVPGGNTAWQRPGAILVEKETGTRYVFTGGALHPVLNQASALLMRGGDAEVELISRESLADLTRGAPVGIPGAPQVVPRRSDLVSGPWLACLPTGSGGGDGLSLDFDPAAEAVALPADRVLSLESPGGTAYLLAAVGKFPLTDPTARIALGLASTPAAIAPRAWLAALPSGPPVGAADIPGAGSGGPSVGGRAYEVGQLFRLPAASGTVELFVLRRDGLAPLSPTEFALLAARPGTADPVELAAADVAVAPRSADQSLLTRLPDLTGLRAFDPGGASVCLRQRPSGDRVVSVVALADGRRGGVRLRPGTAVLAGALPPRAGRKVPDRYLITDEGLKFPLPDDESITALGLGGAPVTPVAGDLLAAVPTGPVLSRAAMT